MENASQAALERLQGSMEGQAEMAGFAVEEDVIKYIEELRRSEG